MKNEVKTPEKARAWVEARKPETTSEARSLFRAYWGEGNLYKQKKGKVK